MATRTNARTPNIFSCDIPRNDFYYCSESYNVICLAVTANKEKGGHDISKAMLQLQQFDIVLAVLSTRVK